MLYYGNLINKTDMSDYKELKNQILKGVLMYCREIYDGSGEKMLTIIEICRQVIDLVDVATSRETLLNIIGRTNNMGTKLVGDIIKQGGIDAAK